MKTYKLNYKDVDGNVLVTLGLLAKNAVEAKASIFLMVDT